MARILLAIVALALCVCSVAAFDNAVLRTYNATGCSTVAPNTEDVFYGLSDDNTCNRLADDVSVKINCVAGVTTVPVMVYMGPTCAGAATSATATAQDTCTLLMAATVSEEGMWFKVACGSGTDGSSGEGGAASTLSVSVLLVAALAAAARALSL